MGTLAGSPHGRRREGGYGVALALGMPPRA
jgi:hypothetical protein